jgi:hypothetical protein
MSKVGLNQELVVAVISCITTTGITTLSCGQLENNQWITTQCDFISKENKDKAT